MNARNDVKRPSDQSLDARLVLAAAQLRFAARVDFLVARWLERCATNVEASARSGDRTNVSGRGLRKTGVFANSAGDFSAFGRLTRRFGHVETEAE